MKTAREILLENIPTDCYWADMDNLTNTPVRYILEAMQKYADQKPDLLVKYREHIVFHEGIDYLREGIDDSDHLTPEEMKFIKEQ